MKNRTMNVVRAFLLLMFVMTINYSFSQISAGEDATICGNTYTMNAELPTGAYGMWLVVGGSATIIEPTNPRTMITNLGEGGNTFKWLVTGEKIESVDFVVISNKRFTVDAGTDQNLCTDKTVLNAQQVNVGTGTWELVAGNGLISDINSPITSVSQLGVGLNVFRWKLMYNDCMAYDEVLISNNMVMANAGQDLIVCTDQVTLNAVLPTTSGMTGYWQIVAGSATILRPTEPVTTVSNLADGINEFEWIVAQNNCKSADKVVIAKHTLSAFAGENRTVCGTEAILAANIPTMGVMGEWTIVAGGGKIANPRESKTIVNELQSGANVFRWKLQTNECMAQADVVITSLNVTANAGIDKSVCGVDTKLEAILPSTEASGTWSVVSGDAVITDRTNNNTSISYLATGINVFVWTVKQDNCFAKDEVVIKNDKVLANAGDDNTICGETDHLRAVAPPVGKGYWTSLSNSAVIENDLMFNTTVTHLSVGRNVFRWTVFNNNCISSDEVIITSVAGTSVEVEAGENKVVCAAGTALNAANPTILGATGMWSVVYGEGTFINSTLYNTEVTGIANGKNVYRWTVAKGDCQQSDDVIIESNMPMVSAGKGAEVCSSEAVLFGYASPNTITKWTTNGNAVIAAPNLLQTTVSNLQAGGNVFTLTATSPICSQTVTSLVEVNSLLLQVNAGNDMEICEPQASISATLPVSQYAYGYWEVVEGGGMIANPKIQNTTVSNLMIGINKLRWTVFVGNCKVTDEMLITYNGVQAKAMEDKQVCDDKIYLVAYKPLQGTGVWSTGAGNVVFSNKNEPFTLASGLSAGVTDFVWTVTNKNCTANDNVIITSNKITVNAGASSVTCADKINLSASVPPAGYSGVWSVITGKASFTDPKSATSVVGDLQTGITILQWTVSNTNCMAWDTLTINNNRPTIANAGQDQMVCRDATVLSANYPIVGTGKWSVIGGSATLGNDVSAISQAEFMGAGTTTFRWTITNGTCTSYDDVAITNNSFTIMPLPTQNVCVNSVTLDATTNSTTPSVFWKMLAGAATFSNEKVLKPTLTNLQKGENIALLTVSSNGCTEKQEVKIIYDFADAGADFTICGTVANLKGSKPVTGIGLWTKKEIGMAGNITSNLEYATSVTNLTSGSSTFVWRITNGGCTTIDEVIVTTKSIGDLAVNAGTDIIGLCTNYTNLAATALEGGRTGEWQILEGYGYLKDKTSPMANISELAPGRTVLRWIVTEPTSKCQGSDEIIIINDSPSMPKAESLIKVCSSSARLHAEFPLRGVGKWIPVQTPATIVGASFANPLVENLAPGENTFKWIIEKGNCVQSQVVVVVNNSITTLAGAKQEVCEKSTTLNAQNPTQGLGKWTVEQGAGTFYNQTAHNSVVSNLGAGVNVFRWTVENMGCTANDRVVIINNSPKEVYPGKSVEVCYPKAMLAANIPDAGFGRWQAITAGLEFENNSMASTVVRNLKDGSNQLRWTVYNGTCSRSEILTIYYTQVIADAGIDRVVCEENAMLSAILPANAVGQWRVDAGNAVIVTPSSANTQVKLGFGPNTFKWMVSKAGCMAEDVVSIINAKIKAEVGSPVKVCENRVTLMAKMPMFARGEWIAMEGNPTIYDATMSTTVVDKLMAGKNSFKWRVTSEGKCVDEAIFEVYNIAPSIPNAGIDRTITTASTTLSANVPTMGVGRWEVLVGNATLANATLPNTEVTDVGIGPNLLRWVVRNNDCSAADELIINRITSAVSAGMNQVICEPNTRMSANIPTSGTGRWIVLEGSGVITDATNPNTSVLNLAEGRNRLAWVITDNTGNSISDDVLINNQRLRALAGEDIQVCESEVVLTGNMPYQTMKGMWEVVVGNGEFLNKEFYRTKVLNLKPGANIFRWTIENDRCRATDEVMVMNNKVEIQTVDFVVEGNMLKITKNPPEGLVSRYTFDDGHGIDGSSGQNHSFANGGIHEVCVTMMHKESGCLAKKCERVMFGNETNRPKAEFTYQLTLEGNATKAVFTNTSSGNYEGYYWDFSNGRLANTANTEMIFQKSGFYNVCLVAYNKTLNIMDKFCREVEINNPLGEDIKADFAFYIDRTQAANTIAFKNMSSNNTRRWSWSFGDGTMDTIPSPVHIFPREGYYKVCLNVFNDTLKINAQKCVEIQVGGDNKSCEANFDYTIDPVSQEVTLTDKSQGVDQWLWEVGAGKILSGKEVKLTYPQAGVYKVRLKVRNSTTQCMAEKLGEVMFNTNTTNEVVNADFSYFIHNETDTVFFRDISMGQMSRWYWELGDGTVDTTANPRHKYTKAGKYVVCLTAFNKEKNLFFRACREVIILPKAGLAQSQALFTYIIEPNSKQIAFFDKSVGQIGKWYWEFGNGIFSTDKNPVYTFETSGTINVCLNIHDNLTNTNARYCEEVVVKTTTDAKVIRAEFSHFVDAKIRKIVLTDLTEGDASRWYWTFGDGKFKEVETKGNIEHQYEKAGVYEVCLIAYDRASNTKSQVCRRIVVADTCSIHADYQYFIDNASRKVTFTDISTGEPNKWFWSFGDGKTSMEQNPTYTYTKGGMYHVAMAAINVQNQCVDYQLYPIQVGEAPCFANFEFIINSGNTSVQFDNKSKGEKFFWLFGDGNQSMEANPLYTYKEAGLYFVTLIVSNATGSCVDKKTIPIQVGEVSCSAFFEAIVEGDKNNVRFKNQTIGHQTQLLWDFGDGQSSTVPNPVHRYSSAGYFTVTLSTYNSATGCMDKYSQVILVSSEGKDTEAEFDYQIDNKTVKFFDKSTGSVNKWVWNFHDETPVVQEQNPSHTFAKAGIYKVCLVVANPSNISNITCKEVKVGTEAEIANLCKADFIYTLDTLTKEVVCFDKSLGVPNVWTWNIFDSKRSEVWTEKLQNTEFQLADTGIYIAKLSIANTTTLCKDWTAKMIKVASKQTGIQAGFVYQVNKSENKATGYPVDMAGAAFGDPAKVVWKINGNVVDTTSVSPTFNFDTPGTYTVCMTVSDPISSTENTSCQDIVIEEATAISEQMLGFATLSNYPNPFSANTQIQFAISEPTNVEISVFDVAGKKVATLANSHYSAGTFQLEWNAIDIEAGVYFLKMNTSKGQIVNKMILTE